MSTEAQPYPSFHADSNTKFVDVGNREEEAKIFEKGLNATTADEKKLYKGLLYKELYPLYQRLKEEGIRQFHFYSKDNKVVHIKEDKFNNIKIAKKISNIFSSPRFVYKLPVEIITKTDQFYTELVAKNNKLLITKDKKEIRIDDIVDIKEK